MTHLDTGPPRFVVTGLSFWKQRAGSAKMAVLWLKSQKDLRKKKRF